MDTAAQYEKMRTIRDNNVQATVCLNRAYPECSPENTCMMYFTTLYMSDDWGNVKAEDYYKTKNYVANKMIDRFEQDTGAKLQRTHRRDFRCDAYDLTQDTADILKA